MAKRYFPFFVIPLFFSFASFALESPETTVEKELVWEELDKASFDLIYEKIPDDKQQISVDLSTDRVDEIDSSSVDQINKEQTDGDQSSTAKDSDGQIDFDSLDEKQKPEESKRFNWTTGFQQISGFITSANHISQLYLNGVYRFAESWSLSFSQAVDRHYFLNPNSEDRGIWLQDTILYTNKQFRNLPYKSRLKAGVSFTLPLSYVSQIHDTYTVGTGYFNWSLKIDPLLDFHSKWIKDFTLFIKPVARHYVSAYTTSRGGRALPKFLFGIQNIGLSFSIGDYFSLSGGHGIWAIYPYKIQYEGEKRLYDEYYREYYYHFSFAGTVKINKQWTAELSYSLIDRLDRQGYMEMVLFDDRLSTWALSVSYSLSFNSI